MIKPPRTSETHPLRIDAVRAGHGLIGMTLLPGRRDAISPEGEWRRDIVADMEAVVAWHPAMMITLMESHEFAHSGVPAFERHIRESGLPRWEHLAIPDGGVPDRTFEAQWARVGPDAEGYLRAGERVLIHCRAGLGRAGTVAARLLIEIGVPVDEAIERIRAKRPKAIELEQERYLRQLTKTRTLGQSRE